MSNLSFRPKKSKLGLRLKTHHAHHNRDGDLEHEVKEMFIGHHTIFSLLGLTIGGTLIARTLWQWLTDLAGLFPTLLVGILVFSAAGIALHSFHDSQIDAELEKEEEEDEQG